MSRVTRALRAGAATGVGSLPHLDVGDAVEFSRFAQPDLPAAPELPRRSAAESMVTRCLDVTGEELDAEAHGGFVEFFEALKDAPPVAAKVQAAGPLTLGLTLLDRGTPAPAAFSEGAERSAAMVERLMRRFERDLPHTEPVVFLDEPALTAWRAETMPWDREAAVDLLSGALSSIDAVTGVHVCGDGDRRMAIEAGPDIVGFPVVPSVLEDGVALGRFLDGGGWLAWGVVPTDGPLGPRPDHSWNELVSLWCDLTRAGCDPVALRTQALVTPACGLAGHSEDQAVRILEMCVEIGERVREQAVATRLSVGA